MFTWIKQYFKKQQPDNQWIADVAIAGLQHYRGNDLAELIQLGDTLALKLEPQNPYDANAIMVLWRHNKIGYVPASIARDIRRQLQAGEKLIATIIDIKPVRFGRKWIKIRLTVDV